MNLTILRTIHILSPLVITVIGCKGPNASDLGKTPQSLPNVVIIYTDDQAQEDIGIYTTRESLTPAIDEIAENGVRFQQFYTASPVCTPSRVALMTGKTPVRAGFNRNAPKNGRGLPLSNKTMANFFKDQGYTTALIGKWHLGENPEYHPNSRGFDYFYGHLSGVVDNYTHQFRWNQPHHHDLWENRRDLAKDEAHMAKHQNGDEEHLAISLMNKAQQFIANAQKPFFLYYAINQPHYPIQPLEGTIPAKGAGDTVAEQEADRHYQGFVKTIDHMVMSLRSDLEVMGKLDNTIMIFQSDHGHSAESRNWEGISHQNLQSNTLFRQNHPYRFRGTKFSHFEGGIRVPAIISWPSGLIPKNEVRNQMAVNTDWLPTLAALINKPLPSYYCEGDCLSLMPIIESDTPTREHYFWHHYSQGWALREGTWKLLKKVIDPYVPVAEEFFLVNLVGDPKERSNLFYTPEHHQKSEAMRLKGEALHSGLSP